MNYIKYTGIVIGIIITSCIVLLFAWSIWFVANFHGDKYKDAETYVITEDKIGTTTINTEKIIDMLYKFQYTYPEYRLITINEKGEYYHNFIAEKGYQYNPDLIFFYFKDIDLSVSCIVEISKNNAVIKLYAINNGVIFRDWKRINNYKEISRKENKEIKKKFETEILDKLGIKWEHKRWWN
jgi:hypothetical protein